MTTGPKQEETPSVDGLIKLALQFYGTGDLVQADELSLKARQIDPTHAAASHLAGIIAYRTGRLDRAIELISEAVKISPDYSEAHENLGNAFRKTGDNDAALACYTRALEIRSDFAEGHYRLGNFLSSLGQSKEAVARFETTLDLKPDYFEACNNLGIEMEHLGNLDKAVDCYRRALEIKPDYAGARINLGNVMYQTGRLEDAAIIYRQVLEAVPDNIEASSNLCIILRDLGRLPEALEVIEKLLITAPTCVPGLNSHGLVLHSLGRLDEAAGAFREALVENPDFVEACNNLGCVLTDKGKPDEAINWFKRALALRPDHASALNNLGRALQTMGQPELAATSFRAAIRAKPDLFEAYSSLLYGLKLSPGVSASDIKNDAIRFGQAISKGVKPWDTWNNSRDPDRPIRVGFVSGDLRRHVIARLLEPVFGLETTRTEFYAYANSSIEDATTSHLRSRFANWRSIVGVRDDHVANLIRDDRIDILIDLSNHTSQNRLPVFAYKPAPVQATWLGLFGTSGVPGMDYILGDPWISPAAEASDFTEQSWRLPETWFCTAPPPLSIDTVAPPAITNGFVTFGCFNSLAKINDHVISVWSDVLKAVSGSRLILKILADPHLTEAVRERFADQGISGDQLVLEEKSPTADYFAAYNRIDIALDPFPFSGGMTSLDSLWMAVPVLTRRGERAGSHTGESVAHNAGLSDWIARDDVDYVNLAVSHSSDLQELAQLRGRLRQQVLASPLFDRPRFARNFELALTGMWKRYCEL
jgi:protein O-GlcNAc transferase